MFLLLGVSFTLTSALFFAPASSAQDPAAPRIECDYPTDDFVLLCLAFDAVVNNFVDAVVVADLAEAAKQGVTDANLAPATAFPRPCALPAPEFEDMCAEIDKVENTREAALAGTRAMLASLNDDFTRLLTPVFTEMFFSTLDSRNSRAGIGIEYALLGIDENPCFTPSDTCRLTIIEVYPGSSAEIQGLVVGDVIIEYGKPVSDQTCRELLDLDARNYLNEYVSVGVLRDGEIVQFYLATTEIVDPPVSSRIVDGEIGYIQIDIFATGAQDSFEEHLRELLNAGVKAIVVDLRNNPGGYLNTTGEIVNLFLERGDLSHRIVSFRVESSIFAPSDGIASDAITLPMAITVNESTASGSELLVLAMRGNDRAKVVGITTFGKNTGQLTFTGESADGRVLGAVQITSLRFFGPEGLSSAGGIQPDIVAEMSDCAHPIAVAREAVAALVPRISKVAVNSAPIADAYGPDEKVIVAVHFDAPIVVNDTNGEPFLNVQVGADVRRAEYTSSSNANGVGVIEFEYTICDDTDDDGISIENNSINLNGATIRRVAAGWDAILDHHLLAADPKHAVATDPERFFGDIAETSFVKAINWLARIGVTTGCGQNTYCPDQPVTRGQMAAFMNRALQLPAADQDYFTDDDDSTFEDDINRLRHAGITQGCGQNTYCPDQPVTRGQMAAFLHRARDLITATGQQLRESVSV